MSAYLLLCDRLKTGLSEVFGEIFRHDENDDLSSVLEGAQKNTRILYRKDVDHLRRMHNGDETNPSLVSVYESFITLPTRSDYREIMKYRKV